MPVDVLVDGAFNVLDVTDLKHVHVTCTQNAPPLNLEMQ